MLFVQTKLWMNNPPTFVIFGASCQWQTQIKWQQQSWHYDPAAPFGKSKKDRMCPHQEMKMLQPADLKQSNGTLVGQQSEKSSGLDPRSQNGAGRNEMQAMRDSGGKRRKTDKAEVKAVEACKSLQNHLQSRPNGEGPFLQLGKCRRRIKKKKGGWKRDLL